MPLDLSRLRKELKPFRVHFFSRLRSTNDHAAVMRRRGDLFGPAVVVTGRQMAGRGRGSNAWWSNEGVLTATFAVAIEEHLAAYQVPLVAGLATRNAAAELTGEEGIGLKWPNDVVIEASNKRDGRGGMLKLAGLLCERIHHVDLIGIGLNVNVDPRDAPAGLRGRLTSLKAIAGKAFDLNECLIVLARHVHRTLSMRTQRPFAALLEEYGKHDALIGRRVTVVASGEGPPITGRCAGLDGSGRLLVKEKGKEHRIISGHVEVASLTGRAG
jgi:BirA family biotin operon repressor/biotin-[acetyl-CoA-carboxylase] ligase